MWIIGIIKYGFLESTIWCLGILLIFSLPDILFALADRQGNKILKMAAQDREESSENEQGAVDAVILSSKDEVNKEASPRRCPSCNSAIPDNSIECPYCETLSTEARDTGSALIEEEHDSKLENGLSDVGFQGKEKGGSEMAEKNRSAEKAKELLEDLHRYIHRRWYSACLQEDYNPTFVMSVILHDNDGEFVEGRLLGLGPIEIVKYHAKGILESINKEKGEFIKW